MIFALAQPELEIGLFIFGLVIGFTIRDNWRWKE